MNVPKDPQIHRKSRMGPRANPTARVTIGISDHAQEALGDLVFVELPAVGRKLAAREACAVVESVKAASDVYAPVAGEVVAVNDAVDRCAGASERGCLRGVALEDEAGRCERGVRIARRCRVRKDRWRSVTESVFPTHSHYSMIIP